MGILVASDNPEPFGPRNRAQSVGAASSDAVNNSSNEQRAMNKEFFRTDAVYRVRLRQRLRRDTPRVELFDLNYSHSNNP